MFKETTGKVMKETLNNVGWKNGGDAHGGLYGVGYAVTKVFVQQCSHSMGTVTVHDISFELITWCWQIGNVDGYGVGG